MLWYLTFGLLLASQGSLAGFCDDKKTSLEDLVGAYKKAPLTGAIRTPPARSGRPGLGHNLPTELILISEGYPAEVHTVTTPDGYILTMHRIPYGKTNTDATNRPVVFLQHGLLCSSADWVIPTPSKGLGYMLAEAGYDVWMGNYRGNTYSRNHTFFDPEDGTGGFWDFAWDEMAHYDIPSQIEKVLEVTGAEELHYVGHSMGTTAFMAMHHYRKDIGEKIRLAHFLSPVAYVGHMQSPIGWIASLGDFVYTILSWFGIGEFLPSNMLIDCLASLFCHESITQGLCSNIMFILAGFDEGQMNKTLLETIVHHTPAGASTTTILQYAQEVTSNGFHGYDWRDDKLNFQHHGGQPPVYRVQDVTTPVAIYYGQNDWLAASQDVLRTIAELPHIVPGMLHMIEYPKWNHLDFLWGVDADRYVYQNVIKNMKTCQDTDCRLK